MNTPKDVITYKSPNYGEVKCEYVDTINTYLYDLGKRYQNLGSVHVVPVNKEDPYDPFVHLYVPTNTLNPDLPIATTTKEEVKSKLSSLKK